jgi:hypothetical protein
MLRLFYSPGACSLVPHIALEEAGAEFEAVRVVLAQGEHLKGDYLAINPHARVPALIADGRTITEISRFSISSPTGIRRREPFRAGRCWQQRAAMSC